MARGVDFVREGTFTRQEAPWLLLFPTKDTWRLFGVNKTAKVTKQQMMNWTIHEDTLDSPDVNHSLRH